MNLRTIIRVVISTAFVAAALWFLLRDVDIAEVVALMGDSNLVLLAATVPMIVASHLLRAVRWRILLRPAAPNVKLSTAFSAVMIGYAVNTIIPRLGEVVRPWIFAKRESLPMPLAGSSVLVERVIDVLTLLISITAVVVISPDVVQAVLPGVTVQTLGLKLGLPALVLIGILVMVVFTNVGPRLVQLTVARLRPALAQTLEGMLHSVRDGMRAVREPRLYISLVILSILVWVLYIVPIWVTAQAMPYASAQTLTIAGATTLLLVISVGVTIAPTPGAFGVYQSFAQVGLMALTSATASEALAFAMIAWLVNYGISFIVGGLCWLNESRHGITIASLRSIQHSSSSSTSS
jgi:uncharacterized protein (TIRG00374 family)